MIRVRGYFTPILVFITMLCSVVVLPANADDAVTPTAQIFTCETPEAQLIERGVTSARFGNAAVYTGFYYQTNQNPTPIMARFDEGVQTWCRTDYETTASDHRGYGLYWDGFSLYGVFSSTGVAGSPDDDFRRYTEDGWLPEYGSGFARVAVIARMNPANGDIYSATFLSAVLTNNNVNELTVKRVQTTSAGTVVIRAETSSFPREIDGSRMVCSGERPYPYAIEFTADLTAALGAISPNCTSSSPAPSTAQVAGMVLPLFPQQDSLFETGTNFQWGRDAGSTWYRLYIVNTVGNVIDEWYEASAICAEVCNLPPRNLNPGTYAWYIAGWGQDSGQGPWSQPTIFYIGKRPPALIQRVAPVGLVNEPEAELTWLPDPNALWYRIYLVSSRNTIVDRWYESTQICNAGSCAVPFSGLSLTNDSYSWWVVGWGEGGSGFWQQAPLQFDLQLPAPEVVTPLTPSDGAVATAGEVIFQWEAEPNANWYRVYIGRQNTLAMVYDEWQPGNQICFGGTCQVGVVLSPGDYIWFVNTWGPGGFGSWNSGTSFFINDN